jgi:predicted  nucleic acid-binding Zn-ribbon protein
MNYKEMLDNLKTQSENLRKDLIDLEQLFTMKKEQFFKVQGAIEALDALEGDSEESLDKLPPDAL